MITEKIKKEAAKKGIRKVVKRSGETAAFKKDKITTAIKKAAGSLGDVDAKIIKQVSEEIFEEISSRYNTATIPAVEEIQDLVENTLIKNNHAEIAKAYILYREQRNKIRDKDKLFLDISKTMDGYLNQSDWRVNENSNVNYSIGGLILHNAGTVTANYWLNNIYPKDVAEAHRNGDLHLHDMSFLGPYCAGWSLRQLLEEGFGGVANKINSKPAKHLSTLVSQMVNFLGTLQNEWAGAQAFSSFDTYLAPFVRVDNLTYEEVKQQIQSFIFGINTPSRWGSQAPFTNVTLDWVVPDDLKDYPIIIGGESQDTTYGDYQEEMNIVNKAFLEVMIEGDADGRGFAYPIPTYNITKDFDWDSPNSDLLFGMSAKYGTPYFQNFINSSLNPEDVRSMCCRLQLDKRELRNRGGGLFGADEMTGSIGVVTLNLSRIGYTTMSRKDFFTQLDHLVDLASESLVIKRKVCNQLMETGLYPYTKRYLGHFNNHFSTIGINGMHECALNFLGKGIETEEGKKFALDIMDHLRARMQDLQEETGDMYNLEATPAESTSYRLAKIDREKYPDIVTSGERDPYYTNSTQLPVGHTPDIFEALDHQDDLQMKYTGGTVLHAFLGERLQNSETCKKLVRRILENYHIPYLTISPTFSICPIHGYLDGEQFFCPKCEQEEKLELSKILTDLEQELKRVEA